jgi:hypothetical protein
VDVTAVLRPSRERPGPLHSGLPVERYGAGTIMEVRPLPLVVTALYAVAAAAACAGLAIYAGLLLGVVMVAVAAGGYALAARPRLLTLIAVTLAPVTAGLARGLPVPGLRLSEIIVVATAVVVFGRRGWSSGPRWGAVDWLGAAYVGLGIVLAVFDTMVVQRQPLGMDALQVVVGPLQFFLLYRCVVIELAPLRARGVALACVLLASVPVSLLAVAQILGPESVQNLLVKITATTVFDTHGFTPLRRATSVFSIWHSLGAYLVLIILVVIALLLERSRSALMTIGLVALLLLSFAALALTLTTTAILMAVVGGIIVGLWYRRLLVVAIVFGITGAAAAITVGGSLIARLGNQAEASQSGLLPQTLAYRVQVWTEQYLPFVSKHLALGYGPELPPGVAWQHTESGYLTLLLRGGIPLLAVTAVLVVAVYLLARRTQRETVDSDRALAMALGALCLLLPVGSLVFPYLNNSGLPLLMFPLWGLLVAGANERRLRRGGGLDPDGHRLPDHSTTSPH